MARKKSLDYAKNTKLGHRVSQFNISFGDTGVYIRFSDEPVYKTKEVREYFFVDFDVDGDVVGVELVI